MVELEQYLLVMAQNGEGCDYTIGCGKTFKIISLPVNNEELRIEKLKEYTTEAYSYKSDNTLSEAYLIPLRNVETLPIGDWYCAQKRADQNFQKNKQEQAELAQLNYLMNKYKGQI